MPSNSLENQGEIIKRFDVLIRLVLDYQRENDPNLTIGDQILLMEDVGLSPSEAGRILGISASQISSYTRYAKNKELKRKVSKKK